MSNSRAKYEELLQEVSSQSQNQRSLHLILDVLIAADKVGIVDIIINKALFISKNFPNLSPVVVFQLAAEETKVDELYT